MQTQLPTLRVDTSRIITELFLTLFETYAGYINVFDFSPQKCHEHLGRNTETRNELSDCAET